MVMLVYQRVDIIMDNLIIRYLLSMDSEIMM